LNSLDEEQSSKHNKKSQFNIHNDGDVSIILSLKELLNVSSDWMDVKSSNKNTGVNLSGASGGLSTQTGGAN
jgi:hypothetical protein